MKKQLKKLAMCIALCLTTVLVACGSAGGVGDISDETAVEAAKQEQVTVIFKNDSDTLGTISINAGDMVTGYEEYENLDGYEFLGWFETPTFLATSQKDLSTVTFSESTTLYGSFKNLNVKEDTRKWTIVGAGTSPALAASNWNNNCASSSVKLVATGNEVNEFALTVDLFEGDQFQVIHDFKWDDQRGYGWFSELDAACFENGGGLGGSDKTSNVNVIKDGNYTITLVTDPDNSAMDKLTIVRNGDPVDSKAEVETKEFVIGESTQVVVKGSWVADWSENKELSRMDGTNSYTITMELEAGTELYFMIWDSDEDTGMGLKGAAVTDDASKALLEAADNVKVAEAGTYTFTADLDAMTISVAK